MLSVGKANSMYNHIYVEGCDRETMNYYISLIDGEIRKEPDSNNILVMESWIQLIKEKQESISSIELRKGTV